MGFALDSTNSGVVDRESVHGMLQYSTLASFPQQNSNLYSHSMKMVLTQSINMYFPHVASKRRIMITTLEVSFAYVDLLAPELCCGYGVVIYYDE